MKRIIPVLIMVASIAMPAFAQEGGYTRILSGATKKMMFNLGPTGIWAYGLHTGGRRGKIVGHQFIVDRVENGSPAHGIVQKLDIITGANGTPFPEIFERAAIRSRMAFAITESEAKDGKLKLQINRGGTPMTVTVQLKKLPDYSPTWPFDCKRSNSIIYNACDYLAREQMPEGDVVADDGYIGPLTAGLLFLASGEPRYLQNAVRAAYWASETVQQGGLGGCWSMGYAGLLMAEYYHMTGDKNILPGLECIAKRIAKGQMPSGGWSHGPYGGFGAGYGEVNCAGMVCYMALSLAKETGVKVDERAYRKAKRYFESYADAVAGTYGDGGYGIFNIYQTRNGKTGGQGVAHFLAGEKAYGMNYAKSAARDLRSFEGGHTGHYFNAMWTTIGASYAPAKDFRFCMDQVGWYFTMARHWRGGMYCTPLGGPKYSHEGGINMTTGGYGLVFALGRRHLRILGAPKGVFSQKLPAELVKARDLHQDDKWDAAIAAVDAYLKKGGHNKENIRLANELRDKSRYIKEGVKAVYPILEQFASGGRIWSRPHKASKIIGHMLKLVEGDPKLIDVRSRLTEPYRGVWRHGRNYHDAYRTLRTLNTYTWFIFSTLVPKGFGDFAMPADSPLWQDLAVIHPKEAGLKVKIIDRGRKGPSGWQKIDYDDSNWSRKFKVSKREANTKAILVRLPFDLKNPDATALKTFSIRHTSGYGAGSKAYINGVCVLKSVRGGAEAELLDKACTLLKKGRNVFAIEAPFVHDVPGIRLCGVMSLNNQAFEWAHYKNSDRDSEYRTLVAKRGVCGASYDPKNDKRTINELVAVFKKKDFLMPENSYARNRYFLLNPSIEERTRHVNELFKSRNYGANFTAIALIYDGLIKFNPGHKKYGAYKINRFKDPKLKAEFVSNMEQQQARDKARMAKLNVWAQTSKPQIIKCLKHEHVFVRRWAVETIGMFDTDCKEAIPTLIAMSGNVEGDFRFTRELALRILKRTPLTHEQWLTVMRSGLSDPSSAARGVALNSFTSKKNPEEVAKAMKYLQNEMLEQIFTAPHGMFSKTTRSQFANLAIERLPKEKLRELLPRFLESLRRPTGEQLKGCLNILSHFGEEVVPDLLKYTKDEDMKTRHNACLALTDIVIVCNLNKPEVIALLKKQLQSVVDADLHRRSDIAKATLKRLEDRGRLGELAASSEVKVRYAALSTMEAMMQKGTLSAELTAVFKRELPRLATGRNSRPKKWAMGMMQKYNIKNSSN